jgi:hypothetical protein
MKRCLVYAAIAVLMTVGPALAGDTQPSGGDASTGAKQQSSAPPGSDAAEDNKSGATAGTSSDTSTGAKEQSSAPPDSSAADKSKPNPTSNSAN